MRDPVIATRVGGVSELVVPEQTGWLVAPYDDLALAQALRSARAPDAELERMGALARRLAMMRVSPAVVAQQLRETLPLPEGRRV